MESLQAALTRLQETLSELDGVLAEEIKQLSGATIHPVSLQHLSDMKSRLLATVACMTNSGNSRKIVCSCLPPISRSLRWPHSGASCCR